MENQTQPGKLQPQTIEELLDQAEINEQDFQALSEKELEVIAGGDFRDRLKSIGSKANKCLGPLGNIAIIGSMVAPLLVKNSPDVAKNVAK